MTRLTACLLACCLLSSTPLLAHADIAGQWTVEWEGTVPSPSDLNVYIVQNDAKLTGNVFFSAGAFPFKGTIDNDHFSLVWSYVVDGEIADITFSGTVTGDAITGRVTIGKDKFEAPLWAERTGR